MKEKRKTTTIVASCTAALLLAGAAFALATDGARSVEREFNASTDSDAPSSRTRSINLNAIGADVVGVAVDGGHQVSVAGDLSHRRITSANATESALPPVQLDLVAHSDIRPASRITTTRKAGQNNNAPAEGGIAGDPCGEGAGTCCAPNGTPGCDDVDCCNLVCGLDDFCCDFEWDQSCVDSANAFCGDLCAADCGSPGTGGCCVENGTPFCDDEECCNQICAIEPFCCDNQWDLTCAAMANDPDTGCSICVNEACTETSGTCCLANGTPGCDDPQCCNTVCSIDPFCCDVTFDAQCAATAQAECGDLCTPEGCGDAIAISCCGANIPELQTAGCNNEACCNTVCAEDAFCCDTAWDLACALTANDLCGCNGLFANLDSFQGVGFTHGGDIAADLLRLVEPGVVREIGFSLTNFTNPVTSIDVELVFMPVEVDEEDNLIEPDPDGPNVVVIPYTAGGQAANTVSIHAITDPKGFFDTNDLGSFIPEVLWAGIRIISAEGNTIDEIGQGLFNPPTVGFSDDGFWLEGFGFAVLGGGFPTGPVSNYGWELLTDEPGTPDNCLGGCYSTCFEEYVLGTGAQLGWGYFAVNAPASPLISDANPADGDQHMRIVKGPGANGSNNGGLSPLCEKGANTMTVDVFVSAGGGADYHILSQAPSQGFLTTRLVLEFQGNIFVLDEIDSVLQFVDTQVPWVVGEYRTVRFEVDNAADEIRYYYDDELIYTGAIFAGTTIEQAVLLSDNFHNPGEFGDFDNLFIGDTDFGGEETGACLVSNCPADLDDSGSVGVPDLLALLACWGDQPGCEDADLDESGSVGVPDLLELLSQWGDCDDADCQTLTEAACDAAGGDYQGDGSSCP